MLKRIISVILIPVFTIGMFAAVTFADIITDTFVFDSSATPDGHTWEGWYRAVDSVPNNDEDHADMRAEGTPYYNVNSALQLDFAATGTKDSEWDGVSTTTRYDNLTTADGENLLKYLLNDFGAQMYILDGGKQLAYDLWNTSVDKDLNISSFSEFSYSYVTASAQTAYDTAEYQNALDLLNDFLVHAHYNYVFNTNNTSRYDEQIERYDNLLKALEELTGKDLTPSQDEPEESDTPTYKQSEYTFDTSAAATGHTCTEYYMALCVIPSDDTDTAHASMRIASTPYSIVNNFILANLNNDALDNVVISAVNKKFIDYFLNDFGDYVYMLDGGKQKAYDLWNSLMPEELSITYTRAKYNFVATDDQNILTAKSYNAALTALNDYLVHAHYNYAYNTFEDNRYDEQVTRYDTLVKAIFNAQYVTNTYKVDTYKQTNTYPRRAGLLFAGWFSDKDLTVPFTEQTGTAYAKFIDAGITSIKVQSSNRSDNTEPLDLRFISTVDTLDYVTAGFKITFNGQTITANVSSAYKTLCASGITTEYKPTDINENSKYFITYRLNNVPYSAAAIPFTVQAYYTTPDGASVYGESRTVYIENKPLTPITRSQYYCYNQLTDNQKACYDYFYDEICKCSSSIDLTRFHMTFDEFWEYPHNAINYDCPELFWYPKALRYDLNADGTLYKIYPTYLFTGDDKDEAQALIDKRTAEILDGITDSMTDYEKEKIIHDRLISEIVYTETTHCHNIYGALAEGLAVCEGYARAFQYLLNLAGIEAIFSTGDVTEGTQVIYHGWTVVKIDGEWYYNDPTWADQDSINAIFYEYFNINEEELLKSRGLEELAFSTPKCTATKWNYWIVEDKTVNEKDADKVSEMFRRNRNGIVEFHYLGDMDEFWSWFKENKVSILKNAGYNDFAVSGYCLNNEWYIIIDDYENLDTYRITEEANFLLSADAVYHA